MNAADEVAHGMHGSIGSIAGAAFTSWLLSRDDGARRDARAHAASAAAFRARSSVIGGANAALRERLADTQADLEAERGIAKDLRIQLAEAQAHRRTLADEVRRLRALAAAA